MKHKIEIDSTNNNQFMWRIKASNGEILVSSETLESKSGIENTINNLINSIKNDLFEIVDITKEDK